MKILFAASEALPFAASGGLADVVGSLPAALSDLDCDCRVVMPLYRSVKPELRNKMTFLGDVTVDVSWRKQYCGVYTIKHGSVTYYLIDNPYYFMRDGMYGFYDDCERFVFFSRAVLEILPLIEWKPDIIHCNDWQTAMIPVYYDVMYKYHREYEGIKTIYTIHNIQYQGVYGREVVTELMGLPNYHTNLLEFDGCVNLMKGAFETANVITTVSPTYAKEVLDPWYSYGMDRALVRRKDGIKGILNGIDTKHYNPETDNIIAKNYSAASIAGKKKCREDLLKEMGLPVDDSPVIGIVTRLVAHKGIQLIQRVFHEMLDIGCKFVILGSGEKLFEDFFLEMQDQHPDKVKTNIGFKPLLSRKIYAGADFFLMPSQNEPCGLAQMVAMRYGTIPIVRETGGLKDSVNDAGGENGNGFTFKTFDALDMLDAVKRGLELYGNKRKWNALVKRAMNCDFSWKKSAEQYMEMYRQLLEDK
ncbi:MAG: glycogen synthase GlgA [Oscillospiraceae bacterium]|nr:glycogen synthase GlgA [Oscillospiraceae bacterium]